MIKLGQNITALSAQRRLAEHSEQVSTSLTRLSSGMRINTAADDAAGLSIAMSLRADSRIYSQALKNVNDGISAISIAEGALSALKSIAVRQRELVTQAANDTFSLAQRKALDSEANALVEEFNRIVSSTTFNGVSLLQGGTEAVRIQAGKGIDGGIGVDFAGGLERNVGDGTFGYTALSTGISPESIASGDFNGDGKSDLVVVGGASGTHASIYLGVGDGAFTLARTIAVGAEPNFVTTGDINNDGLTDIAVSDRGNGTGTTATILMSQGNGNFSSSTVTNAAGATSLQLADITNDGNVDLISVSAFASAASEITRVSLGATTQSVFVGGGASWTATTAAYRTEGYTEYGSETTYEDGNYTVGEYEVTRIAAADGVDINAVTGQQAELTRFTATAGSEINPEDPGSAESTTFIMLSGSETGSGTSFEFHTPEGVYYVWFNLDSAGSDPGGGGTGIEVNILSSDSASDVANAVKSAVEAVAPVSISTNSGSFTLTNNTVGSVGDASGYGFSMVETDGEDPSFNTDYFTFSTPDQDFYVWFYVDGSVGSDPGLDGTGIQVNISSGDSEYVVAGSVASAINSAIPSYVTAYANGNYFDLENSSIGSVADATGWGSPTVLAQGSNGTYNTAYFTFDSSAGSYYVWFNRDGIGDDPGIAERTGIEIQVADYDTNTYIATLIQNALSSGYGVSTSRDENLVYLTDLEDGSRINATGWNVSTITEGADGEYEQITFENSYTYNLIEFVDNYENTSYSFTTEQGDYYFYFNGNNPGGNGTGINITTSESHGIYNQEVGFSESGGYPLFYRTYEYQEYVDGTGGSYFTPDDEATIAANIVSALSTYSISAHSSGAEVVIDDAGTYQAESIIGNQFFYIFDGDEQYYVWYDVDDGGTDPMEIGTGIEVDITNGDSPTTVAAKTAAAINAQFGGIFDAESSGTDLTITRLAGGPSTNSYDGNTSWSVTTLQQGALGSTDGGAGSVLLGTGNGSFVQHEGFSFEGNGLNFKAVDLNRDGNLDLVGANEDDGQVAVLLGHGNGSFDTAVKYAVGSDPKAVSVGDFNHDGYADVAAANSGDGTISILLGRGDGTLSAATTYAAGSSPYGIITADMNGDGREDLVTTDYVGSRIGVFYGHGNGTFSGMISQSVGAGSWQSIAADFNGDGAADLATAASDTNTAGILLSGTQKVSSMQYLNLLSRDNARSAMSTVDATLNRITSELSNLGGSRSRLSTTMNMLANTRENYMRAEGRIVDADIAEESAQLIRRSIAQSVTTQVLRQTNLDGELVLRLLKN